MLLARVVETSQRVSETSKRLAKLDLLAGLLRDAEPGEIATVISYLSSATPQGRLGIGYAALRGATAEPAASATLQISDVDRAFTAIAAAKGAGSARGKGELLHSLLSRATAAEQHFLNGLVMGEIRQGALEGLMVEALARAFQLPPERVRRAVMMAGDLPSVAEAIRTEGEAALIRFSLQLMRPIQPMLAQTAEDVEDALEELGEAALEWKLDGARIQVHRSGDDVAVYSRLLNDVTAAVPEVVEQVRQMPAKELILEGEVLALRPDGRPEAFQTTMRRFGRRLDVARLRSEIPLTPYWFDLLYADGGDLIDEPQARRFGALSDIVPAAGLVPHLVTADRSRAIDFQNDALRRGHEGVMAKAVDAPYAAGRRGQTWLKVKIARTLDLVILAAEWGNGRRRGWLSNLHLGARDTENGGFAMLGKTFKGLTDEMLAWQTKQLLKLEAARDAYTVYVRPELVAEIAFNEIQVSSRYASGLALRFARVKRYRPDKTASDADTFQTVQALAAAAHRL